MGTDSLSPVLLCAAAASQDHADNVSAMWIAAAGVAISAFVAWVTAHWTIKGDERRGIREGNMRLIELAIEYPFLESDEFCSQWPSSNRDKQDGMRYENFCCHVFNLVQQCFEFCRGDELKMKPILHPDELIWRHRLWWQNDEENQRGYPVEFRQYVAGRIRALTKEKESGS
jgi:hypothetical protein